MADEITVVTGLALSNGLLVVRDTKTTTRFTQTTARIGGGVYDIGTTEETVSATFTDCVAGWTEIVNLDTTNYVQVGFSTTVYGFRLLANGGKALLYLESGATLYLKANTATCKVKITALNQ